MDINANASVRQMDVVFREGMNYFVRMHGRNCEGEMDPRYFKCQHERGLKYVA